MLKLENIKIGIIGFGRFGQFIGKKMVEYGFKVYATSRTSYQKEAKEIGVIFIENNFQQKDLDIVVLAPSILSFEKIITSYPLDFWENKLIVDVLSVKKYPQEILQKYLSKCKCNILLTHPMFGPDSAKLSWNDKIFVYWKEKNEIDNCLTLQFLDFWKKQGCIMKEMNPQEHDKITANSQFLTHFIGRLLELLNCQPSDVDTEGYKSLLSIKEHSMNDSWDLFLALSKYNPQSLETIKKVKEQLNNLEKKLTS